VSEWLKSAKRKEWRCFLCKILSTQHWVQKNHVDFYDLYILWSEGTDVQLVTVCENSWPLMRWPALCVHGLLHLISNLEIATPEAGVMKITDLNIQKNWFLCDFYGGIGQKVLYVANKRHRIIRFLCIWVFPHLLKPSTDSYWGKEQLNRHLFVTPWARDSEHRASEKAQKTETTDTVFLQGIVIYSMEKSRVIGI
jgi:hypothetical protein